LYTIVRRRDLHDLWWHHDRRSTCPRRVQTQRTVNKRIKDFHAKCQLH